MPRRVGGDGNLVTDVVGTARESHVLAWANRAGPDAEPDFEGPVAEGRGRPERVDERERFVQMGTLVEFIETLDVA